MSTVKRALRQAQGERKRLLQEVIFGIMYGRSIERPYMMPNMLVSKAIGIK